MTDEKKHGHEIRAGGQSISNNAGFAWPLT